MTACLPVKPILGGRLRVNNRQSVFRRFSGLKTRQNALSGSVSAYTQRPTHASIDPKRIPDQSYLSKVLF